jgi:hypothetical protein
LHTEAVVVAVAEPEGAVKETVPSGRDAEEDKEEAKVDRGKKQKRMRKE